MSAWTRIERTGATALALLIMARIIPDAASVSRAEAIISSIVWGAIAALLIAGIVRGQTRSIRLRMASWCLLIVVAFLELAF